MRQGRSGKTIQAVHVWRAGENLTRNVWIKNPTKKRPRGRLRQRCIDGVKKNNSGTDESKRLDDAMDLNGWRSLL